MAFKVCMLVTLFAVARAGYSPMPYDSGTNQMMYSMPMDKSPYSYGMDNSLSSGEMYNMDRMYNHMPERMSSTFGTYQQQQSSMMPNNYNMRYTSTYAPAEHSQNYHQMSDGNMPHYQTAMMPQNQYEYSASNSMPTNYHSSQGNHDMMIGSNSYAHSPSSSVAHVSFNGNGANYQW